MQVALEVTPTEFTMTLRLAMYPGADRCKDTRHEFEALMKTAVPRLRNDSLWRRAGVNTALGLGFCVVKRDTLTIVDLSTGTATMHAVQGAVRGQMHVVPDKDPSVMWVVPDDNLPTAFRIRVQKWSQLRKAWIGQCVSRRNK